MKMLATECKIVAGQLNHEPAYSCKPKYKNRMANHSQSNFFDWLAACLVGIVGHGMSIHMQPGPYIVIMNSKQDLGIII